MKNITLLIKTIFSALALLFVLNANAQWQQIGTDIFGIENNQFGQSVALSADGTIMVVGSPSININGPISGEVKVFAYNGSEWIERGESIKGADGDKLGFSVATTPNGSRIIIGSIRASTANGAFTGKAEVFDWDGANWTAVGNALNGSLFFSLFGQVVSISENGNRVAVSAPNYGANNTNFGQVKIYELNGSTWQQMGAEINGEATLDFMGSGMQLSADGNRIAIGTEQSDNAGQNAGNIRIFEWNGTSWEQMGAEIGGEAAVSLFGKSLSFSADGNRVAGGAPYYDTQRGYTKILDWNGTSWTQKGQTIYGEYNSDETGGSVALSADGNTLSVGAYLNPGGGFKRGQVRVYKLVGNLWKQEDAPINGLIDSELIGATTALSANGETVVAASYQSGFHGLYSGVIRVYEGGVLKADSFSNSIGAKVYPIPSKDIITVELVNNYAETTIIQYDVFGKLINSSIINNQSEADIQLKGSAGIYFISITADGITESIRVMKQ